MADGMLSQEEIDALTKNSAPDESQKDTPQKEAPAASEESSASSADTIGDNLPLTDIEKDTLGEIGNISMGSAATTLSTLLSHKVSITTPKVTMATMAEIKMHYPMPYLIVEVRYTTGISGSNIFAIQTGDAAIIADLMMGGDGTNVSEELDEIRQSAVNEAMNQMMGAVSTSLSQIFDKKIDISPPQFQTIDMATTDKVADFLSQKDAVVKISFKMEVEGIIDSEIMQILPLDVSRELVRNLTAANSQGEQQAPAPASAPAADIPSAPIPQSKPAPQQVQAQQTLTAPVSAMQPTPASQNIVSNVAVQPAQFTPLSVGQVPVNSANIGLILDVPLNITVELGSTRKSIKEILEMSTGSVIELDKLAGESVDILVNGKLLAKGEVVVIDENFGVRITDIASPLERAKNLS